MPSPSPSDILAAAISTETDWPNLVGDDWPRVKERYNDLCIQLESTTDSVQRLAAAELIMLFQPYSDASKCLRYEAMAHSEAMRTFLGLVTIAEQVNLDSDISQKLKTIIGSGSSVRFVLQSSPTKATSIKLGNLSFEFEKLSGFITGVIAVIDKNIAGAASDILLAGGILLLIRTLYSATAIKLEEREATVFCGFSKAGSEAHETDILHYTNQVRNMVSLKPIDEQELGNALYKLAEIKSIKKKDDKPGTWLILEQHCEKDS